MPENVTLTSSSLTPLPPEVCDWQRKESLRSDSQWAFTSLPGTGRSILLSAVQVAARRERGSYWYQIIADYKSRYRGRVFPSSSLPSFLPSCFREPHSAAARESQHKSQCYRKGSIGEGHRWHWTTCCFATRHQVTSSKTYQDTECYIMVSLWSFSP